jgi:hypothetical protein
MHILVLILRLAQHVFDFSNDGADVGVIVVGAVNNDVGEFTSGFDESDVAGPDGGKILPQD